MTQAQDPVVGSGTPGQAQQPSSVRVQVDRYLNSLPFPLPHIVALYVALTIITALVVILFGWGK
jgi:hypothetical protein